MEKEKLSRKDLNKNRVIAYALKAFIKDGIEKVSVSEIANQAGLTERSAFRYFASKADLVLSTALLFWKQLVDKVNNDSSTNELSNLTGLEQVRFIINQYASIYFESKKEFLFILEAEAYLVRNGKAKLISSKPHLDYQKSNGPLARAIKKGLEDKSIKKGANIPYLYSNTYDALLGFMEKLALDEDEISDDVAKLRLDLLINALVNSYAN